MQKITKGKKKGGQFYFKQLHSVMLRKIFND